MKKIFCLLLTASLFLGITSCCLLPAPLNPDSYKIYSGNGNICISNAHIRKPPFMTMFHITMQIDSDTSFFLNKKDLKINYGAEEISGIRISGEMEYCTLMEELIQKHIPEKKDSVMPIEPNIEEMNGISMFISHCDSLLINKGSNIIDVFCKVHKGRFKETVTCTFRPQWASEEIKLLEIYPPKVVRKMRKETKDQTESINR